ncbi:MAG: cyclic di-GMP phosphodiesterase [Chloroflexota bacterium]|nr:cyclic di-GMP phosphodiesterase [Chloroflexota bacterium]
MDKKHTVLIVDDTPENIDILVGILKEQYQLKVATGGRAALDILAEKHKPDLVLLDIMMPEIDGYQVCQTIKADPAARKIPVIFVTAMDDEEDETKGFAYGAVDYITKPVSPPIVLARVATQLALYDQKNHLEELVQERTAEIYDTRLEIVRRLGIAAEYKDNETGQHILRMSQYCKLVGREYGLSTEEQTLLLNASPMHDVGKIGIPDRILLKPGKLDPDEWEVMKTHTTIGGLIIGDHSSELLQTARMIALSHHERWDGTGYPNGLKGENIPIYGRIAAIADVFDALTSERPYKHAWSVEDAVEEIKRGDGTHFDPGIVEAFLAVLPDILEIRAQHQEDSLVLPHAA